MPLQKSPPQGSAALDLQAAKRRQLQERRRTLQTISELSTTDVTSARFITPIEGQIMSMSPQGARPVRTKATSKRGSLPQNYPRLDNMDSRSVPTIPAAHTSTAKQARFTLSTNPENFEAGWNARREKARIQTEQAQAGAQLHQDIANYKLQAARCSAKTKNTCSTKYNESQLHLRNYSSQQQLLRNSPSATTLTSSSERRSSLGSVITQADRHSNDTESSGRISTDSSSYHSAKRYTPRRLRAGSFSGPVPSHQPPPLPTGLNLPTNGQFIRPHKNPDGSLNHPLCFGMQNVASNGPWSNPVMNPDYKTPNHSPIPNQKYSAGKQEPQGRKSPAGQSRYRHQQTLLPTTSPQHNPNTPPHDKPSRAHTSRPSSERTSPRSQSSCKASPPTQSPPPAYTASASTTMLYEQNPDKSGLSPPRTTRHEKRTMPNRESLTQWNTEREEAKAEFDGVQRAKIKERVRRANELELQKEKELRALGKGMANEKACRVLGKEGEGGMGLEKKGGGKRKERGCFGGLFGVVLGRGK